MVGPNIVLTSAHLVPWEIDPWGMYFVPAFRAGTEPFGGSWVSEARRPTTVIAVDTDTGAATEPSPYTCARANHLVVARRLPALYKLWAVTKHRQEDFSSRTADPELHPPSSAGLSLSDPPGQVTYGADGGRVSDTGPTGELSGYNYVGLSASSVHHQQAQSLKASGFAESSGDQKRRLLDTACQAGTTYISKQQKTA